MIAPAVTVWPANTFTPSRWACESRPFFEEPRPFLCAISAVLLRLRRARLPRRLRLVFGARRGRLARRGLLRRGRLLGGRLLRRRLLGRRGGGLLGRLLVGRLLGRRPLRLRRADRVDLDPAQLGAVAAGLLEASLGLEREDLELLAPQVLDDLGGDGALELRAVGDDLVTAGHEHRGRERLARLMRLPVDQERLPLLDLVLLAADLDDRVHEPRNGTKGPVCAWLTAEQPPEEAAAL